MKNLTLIILFLFTYTIMAQKSDSVAYLSNLKGKGLCIRQGSQTNLKIPFFFRNGDKINMLNGNAVIVMNSEEEVKLVSGESFTVLAQNSVHKKQNDLLLYKNTKQSASSFKMRSLGEPVLLVFPNSSKLIQSKNAIIVLKSKMKSKYFFKLTEKNNDKVVYRLMESSDSLINLINCEFVPGKTYIWTLKYPEYQINGTINTLTEEQKKLIPTFDLKNRASYTTAFNYFCREECFFEAYQIIEKAIKAYPEDGYFLYLKKSLFGD